MHVFKVRLLDSYLFHFAKCRSYLKPFSIFDSFQQLGLLHFSLRTEEIELSL